MNNKIISILAIMITVILTVGILSGCMEAGAAAAPERGMSAQPPIEVAPGPEVPGFDTAGKRVKLAKKDRESIEKLLSFAIEGQLGERNQDQLVYAAMLLMYDWQEDMIEAPVLTKERSIYYAKETVRQYVRDFYGEEIENNQRMLSRVEISGEYYVLDTENCIPYDFPGYHSNKNMKLYDLGEQYYKLTFQCSWDDFDGTNPDYHEYDVDATVILKKDPAACFGWQLLSSHYEKYNPRDRSITD